ncbi:MAG: ATP-binding protein [Candidatus Pacebacteria bacterium]|nr:ATP-binding protein [Candidatus Paceibacterota bacterium]
MEKKQELLMVLNIISNFTDGLLFFDEKDRLVLINKKAEKLLDINKKLIGKKAIELTDIPYLETIIGIFLSKQNLQKEQAKINEKTIEVSFINNKGTLIILHDITKEKMVEQMKNEFVSIVAHQLRTPISSIKWTLKMFLEGSFGQVKQDQKKYLEKIYTINERMVELINDLLNIARIEEGRYVYKPVPTNLINLIETIIKQFKEKAEVNQINLVFEKPNFSTKIVIDPEKIKLVLQNFIDNAIKYNHKGGEVFVSLKSDKENITVSVRDTGLGIPKEQQKRIFTKFFRAANVMKTDTEGSGLGLYINKELIEAHKGKIWFESKEGKGSTFSFSLPLQKNNNKIK